MSTDMGEDRIATGYKEEDTIGLDKSWKAAGTEPVGSECGQVMKWKRREIQHRESKWRQGKKQAWLAGKAGSAFRHIKKWVWSEFGKELGMRPWVLVTKSFCDKPECLNLISYVAVNYWGCGEQPCISTVGSVMRSVRSNPADSILVGNPVVAPADSSLLFRNLFQNRAMKCKKSMRANWGAAESWHKSASLHISLHLIVLTLGNISQNLLSSQHGNSPKCCMAKPFSLKPKARFFSLPENTTKKVKDKVMSSW